MAKDECIEVEIVAKSIEPYEKELSAIFKIYSQDVSLYETNLENKSKISITLEKILIIV